MTFVSKHINPQHVINKVSTRLGGPLPTAVRLDQQVTCLISEYNDIYIYIYIYICVCVCVCVCVMCFAPCIDTIMQHKPTKCTFCKLTF